MKEDSNKEKCPKRFGLWAAFIVGMGCMVLAIAVFDYFQRNGERYGDSSNQPLLQTATAGMLAADEKSTAPCAWLGIEVQEIDEAIAKQLGLGGNDGVLVTKVVEGSPSDNAGIERGDVIVRFDRRAIEEVSDLQKIIEKLSPGERVQVVLIRKESTERLYVKLESAPADNLQSIAMEQGIQQWGMAVAPAAQTVALTSGKPDDVTSGKSDDITSGNPDNVSGVMVMDVLPGGRAAQTGLQPGDVISSVNSQPTPDMASFVSAISSTAEGAVFDVSRGAENIYLVAYDREMTEYQNKPAEIPGM